MRIVLPLALALTACGTTTEVTPSSEWSQGGIQGAPPAELVLTVPDLVPGEVAEIRIDGATPGSTVVLAMRPIQKFRVVWK